MSDRSNALHAQRDLDALLEQLYAERADAELAAQKRALSDAQWAVRPVTDEDRWRTGSAGIGILGAGRGLSELGRELSDLGLRRGTAMRIGSWPIQGVGGLLLLDAMLSANRYGPGYTWPGERRGAKADAELAAQKRALARAQKLKQ